MQQLVTPRDVNPQTNHYKTIFLSDIHLGSRACQADLLLDFLKYNDGEKIYLVGDIVDGWRLKSSWYWPQSHNDVVQKILRKARKGTEIIYVPGNHDEGLRRYCGTHFGGIEVRLTDTFGLVMLEAMASGLPVVAYPVTGPLDVLGDTKAAFMDENLSKAVEQALQVTAKQARKHAEKYSWNACTDQFLQNLVRAS